MKSIEKTVLALAIGMAVGAGIGILMAPDKGERTRRKIKREYNNYINKIENKIADLKAKEEELKEKARKAFDLKSFKA